MTLLKEKFPQYFEYRDKISVNQTKKGVCLVALQDMFNEFMSPATLNKLLYMGLYYTDIGYPYHC